MGRIEKKFQKRKERERAVRKKILKRREALHVLSEQVKTQDKLEREVNKAERKSTRKNQPIRNTSPQLREVLKKVQAITDDVFEEDVDTSDGDKLPNETTATAWAPTICNRSDDEGK